MEPKFKIIITRDGEYRRILKKYTDKQYALEFFRKIIIKNEKVKFEQKYINYVPVKYHLEFLTKKKYCDVIEWEKDELGRNIPVPDRDGFWVWKKVEWKKVEYFKIWGVKNQYTCEDLISLIEKTDSLIAMSTIQNHLILDVNGEPIVVILKNVEDAVRLYQVIKDEYLKNILPFGVMSSDNRRFFYQKAKELGIPVKMFYTKSTRW